MAITPGSAGAGQTVASGVEEELLGGPVARVTTVHVTCTSGSSAPVGIRTALNWDGKFATLSPGEEADFRVGDGANKVIYAQGVGGTATLSWYVNAAT